VEDVDDLREQRDPRAERIASPASASGRPLPSQCSSRLAMPAATPSPKRSCRAMSAPRVQRVLIRSSVMRGPLRRMLTTLRSRPASPAFSPVCAEDEAQHVGQAGADGLEVALEGEVVGQVELADPRRVAAAAEVLEQQRVVEVAQRATGRPSVMPMCVPIQQTRMQCPSAALR
jgi:hypothetical protein